MLYVSACLALFSITKSQNKINETMQMDEFLDLIYFSEEAIYKDINRNNIKCINKLTINSFIYNLFLQINSSSKNNNYIKLNNKYN